MKIPLKEIIDDCLDSKELTPIAMVTEIFQDVVSLSFNQTEIGKKIKNALTEEELAFFISNLEGSFLITLFTNSVFENEEDALNYAKSKNCDNVIFKEDPDYKGDA